MCGKRMIAVGTDPELLELVLSYGISIEPTAIVDCENTEVWTRKIIFNNKLDLNLFRIYSAGLKYNCWGRDINVICEVKE